MFSDEKILKLIVSLNRLTSTGVLEWTLSEPPRRVTAGLDIVVPLYIEAQHRGQRFALYQERSRRFDGERDQFYAVEDLVLAVLDMEGRVLFEVRDQYSALQDLFARARASLVDIDSILSDLDDPEDN
ncbi:hypothetical protein [Ralstonia sp.]|uniref:hypothetical protein n=1 Tax=Ralstonia sp. TaxID=54061 RepID=UPI002C59F494|nr:hypothetical protein [Ralstonia sp.]HWV06676.1 hypothetical protein [Ralstonia sp.]